MGETREVLIATRDDWYGNYMDQYGNEYAQLGFHYLRTTGQWRVSCWGNDDFGIDIDSYIPEEAWGEFVDIIAEGEVTKQMLYDRGWTDS